MKQIDIFGNEIDIEELYKLQQEEINKKKGAIPIKVKFRQENGYKEGFYCKNCKYFDGRHHNNKHYYKCSKIGISGASATDIRLKDIACNLYLQDIRKEIK